MAIIYSYPLNDNIKPLDELVGTTEQSINGQLKTVTRNFLLQDLAEFFIVDGGLQKTITLTTSGTSGAAALNQLTGALNIPQYQGALLGTGFVKSVAGVISYDTNSYYLASNPDGFIPLTALSSAATGLTYNNVTGVFSLTVGYSIPTTASQTNWDNAYTYRLAGITTNGTSGAATLINNILNIPQYSGGGGSQNLQQVTDIGAITNNTITINTVNANGLNINTSGSNTTKSPLVITSTIPDATTFKSLSYNGGLGNYFYSDTGDCISLQTDDPFGIGLNVASTGLGISAYSIGFPVMELFQALNNKGLIINSGTSSTGNFIDLNKNGVNKLTVNQAGELIATKLIKEGGTSSQFLMGDGSVTIGNGGVYSYEIHVSQVDGNDTTGTGAVLNPVATITKALTLVSGQRKTIIIHPGNYTESPSITSQYTVLTTYQAAGGNTLITGTVTTNTGCSVSGLKMTNLTINAPTGTGNVNILNCDISGTLTRTNTGTYTLIRFCDIGITNINSTSGTVAVFGGNPSFITINNAGASVLVKNAVCISPVVLVGNATFADCILISTGPTTNALTSSAGTITTLANSQCVIPTFQNVARVSLSGFYSILNCVFDKPNSTLVSLSGTGGTTNSIVYSQFINADKFIKQGGTPTQFLKADGSVDNNTYLTSADLPDASVTQKGLVTTGTQTFAGHKIFSSISFGATGVPTFFEYSGIPFLTVGTGVTFSIGGGPGAVQNNLAVPNGTFNIGLQTASTIASFDANKNVVSLPTATYPSLTELTYVKGVTSAIQTQLNGKQPINANLTSISSLSTSGGPFFVKVSGGNYFLDNSIGSQSAFTILANNTSAGAAPTEQPFENLTNQTYSGTIVWTGTTAPSSTTQHTYSLSQIGNLVTLTINLSYLAAGNAITALAVELPSTAPTPALPTSVSVAGDILNYGNGMLAVAKSIPTTNAAFCALRLKSTSPNIYEVTVNRTSAAYRYAYITIQYFV